MGNITEIRKNKEYMVMQREKEREMWVVNVRARGNSKYIERGGGIRVSGVG